MSIKVKIDDKWVVQSGTHTVEKPIVGVDYFTEEDKNEMVNAVIAALTNADEVSY